MEAMDEPKQGFIAAFIAKRHLNQPKGWLFLFSGLLVGAAAAAGWYRYSLVPQQALVQKRYQSTLDISRMYGLQLTYKRAHGTYANDFAS